MRELDIRNVKYRFLDSSGYFSHVEEWDKAISMSDAVLFIVDGNGIDDGFYFTREIFEKAGPFIESAKIPCYVLMNRAKPNQSIKPVYELADEFLGGVNHSCGSIQTFNEEVFQAFEWLEGTIVAKLKKK